MLPKYLDRATPAQIVVKVFGGHSVEASHPFFQPRVVGVRILDVVDAGQDLIPLLRFTARWATPISRAARAMGPFPPPSEQRTASRARRDPSTALIFRWLSFGRIASAVAPDRSRTTRTGTCSRESPRFAARPPRFRARLGSPPRCPL